MSRGKVDDTEAAHTDATGTVDMNSLVIRAAVHNGLAHGVHNVFPGLTIFQDVAGYAAHSGMGLKKEQDLTIIQLSQSSIYAAHT